MIAALLALSLVPHSPICVSWADVVEINRVYDDKGAHRFDQVCGWNWDDGQLVCDWWRMPERMPTPRRVGSQWHTVFRDKDNQLRRVVSRTVWHSWTPFDREVEDRQTKPVQLRRQLPKGR